MNYISLLVCPLCKSKLERRKNQLICKKCKIRFKIKDGVPDMLLGHAEKI
ncbi:MAG: Trm112 family protein [Candidatus Aenigmatarchaeota archaeon]|nr:MAG: Trm112 family protein [Candidatus Aenigmarchaeota archaeon]